MRAADLGEIRQRVEHLGVMRIGLVALARFGIAAERGVQRAGGAADVGEAEGGARTGEIMAQPVQRLDVGDRSVPRDEELLEAAQLGQMRGEALQVAALELQHFLGEGGGRGGLVHTDVLSGLFSALLP